MYFMEIADIIKWYLESGVIETQKQTKDHINHFLMEVNILIL